MLINMNRYEKAQKYTEKYKSSLFTCKYCGSKNISIRSDRSIYGKPKILWFVCCDTNGCDCTASFTNVKDAVEAWNCKHQR